MTTQARKNSDPTGEELEMYSKMQKAAIHELIHDNDRTQRKMNVQIAAVATLSLVLWVAEFFSIVLSTEVPQDLCDGDDLVNVPEFNPFTFPLFAFLMQFLYSGLTVVLCFLLWKMYRLQLMDDHGSSFKSEMGDQDQGRQHVGVLSSQYRGCFLLEIFVCMIQPIPFINYSSELWTDHKVTTTSRAALVVNLGQFMILRLYLWARVARDRSLIYSCRRLVQRGSREIRSSHINFGWELTFKTLYLQQGVAVTAVTCLLLSIWFISCFFVAEWNEPKNFICYEHQEMDRFSVFSAGYLTIITLTTVGYGDFAPNTRIGRVAGGLCGLCGVLAGAMIVAMFTRWLSLNKIEERAVCFVYTQRFADMERHAASQMIQYFFAERIAARRARKARSCAGSTKGSVKGSAPEDDTSLKHASRLKDEDSESAASPFWISRLGWITKSNIGRKEHRELQAKFKDQLLGASRKFRYFRGLRTHARLLITGEEERPAHQRSAEILSKRISALENEMLSQFSQQQRTIDNQMLAMERRMMSRLESILCPLEKNLASVAPFQPSDTKVEPTGSAQSLPSTAPQFEPIPSEDKIHISHDPPPEVPNIVLKTPPTSVEQVSGVQSLQRLPPNHEEEYGDQFDDPDWTNLLALEKQARDVLPVSPSQHADAQAPLVTSTATWDRFNHFGTRSRPSTSPAMGLTVKTAKEEGMVESRVRRLPETPPVLPGQLPRHHDSFASVT